MLCNDCNGSNIKECYKEGCLVCIDCGLVAEPFLFDTRPIVDSRRCINYDENIYRNTANNDNEIHIAIDKLIIENHNALETYANSIMNNYITKYNFNGHRQPLRAYALYEACKSSGLSRITLLDICHVFQIEETKVLQIYKTIEVTKVSHSVSLNISQRLTRLSMKVITNDAKLRLTALQHCERIESILMENSIFKTKRPSRMDCAILYYVLTNIMHLKIKTRTFVSHCDTTYGTLKKHMDLICSLLR